MTTADDRQACDEVPPGFWEALMVLLVSLPAAEEDELSEEVEPIL